MDGVRFEFQQQNAEQVSVAGEFNGWDEEALPMKRSTNGTWYAEVAIPRGDYGYKFVVDGEWLLDPRNDKTKSVDGVENSRLVTAEQP